MDFTFNSIFAYNRQKKKLVGLISISAAIFLISIITAYFIFFHSPDLWIAKFISTIYEHIKLNIYTIPSLLGVLYTAFFGGLFFVVVPVEPLFIGFMKVGNPFLVMLIYVGGFVISYTINYYIGQKFSGITKWIISPQKFYKLKGQLNRFGGFAIYFINALPLPSQPLAAILGVFKYNMTRFYFYFILGQLTKYIAIIFIYGVFKN